MAVIITTSGSARDEYYLKKTNFCCSDWCRLVWFLLTLVTKNAADVLMPNRSQATSNYQDDFNLTTHESYILSSILSICMMTSSNRNIFRITGPLCRKLTGHRWILPPLKSQWRRTLMFSLIYAWINNWVNNRDAGDLRHHRAHYDITVMGIMDLGQHFFR